MHKNLPYFKFQIFTINTLNILIEIIMAEIKIEQKKRIWPWLLFGLIALSLLFYFVAKRDNNKTEDIAEAQYIEKANENDIIAIEENNAIVAAYIDFVENSKDKMSLDHAYTNEALLKLTQATAAMADEAGYDVKADLEKVDGYAKLIVVDPFETTHADNIRKASEVLTDVLQNIQKAKYPTLIAEVDDLQNATEAIKPAILTLDQKDAVKNYFAKAADLLQKMN
jgi:hypothetical protein